MPQKPEWADYEDKVASFLLQLGFEVQVNETIQGARAAHDIDVAARTETAGVRQLWVAECKSWKRRVPKERVLTFKGIIEDTGADRGLLFSESGFQAGAIQAAQSTNITLTSLAGFEQGFPGSPNLTGAPPIPPSLPAQPEPAGVRLRRPGRHPPPGYLR